MTKPSKFVHGGQGNLGRALRIEYEEKKAQLEEQLKAAKEPAERSEILEALRDTEEYFLNEMKKLKISSCW